MRDTIERLQQYLDQQQPLVYCRLVETRGSTPQKAGALMLVLPDGSQAGTLGGGCVEAEVKRMAIAALQAGVPQLTTFQLDHDYGWDDGLICGGRMRVLLDPVQEPAAREYYQRLSAGVLSSIGLTEAIVCDEAKAGCAAPTALLMDAQGRLLALRGHAPREETMVDVAGALRPLEQRPRAYYLRGIAYLPVLPRCRLIVIGGGHVGKAVADLAVDLDFDVWVVDDRAEFTSEQRFPRVQRRITGPIDQVLPQLEINRDTYCLVITRGHNHDEEALYHVVNRGARYVGLIGSRRKIRLIFDDLLQEGVPQEALDQVFAPLGIDIGSQTVPEIAISICAELIAHRNCDGKVPGRRGVGIGD